MHSGEILSCEEGEGRIAHTQRRVKIISNSGLKLNRLLTASAKLRARPLDHGMYLRLFRRDCIVTGSESVLDPFLALHPSLQLRAEAVLHYRVTGSFNAALHHRRTALSQLIPS